jgi:hypothetical protein
MGNLGRNPTDATTPPLPSEKEMKFLDESQASLLLLAAKGDREETLYYLAIATGLVSPSCLGCSGVIWIGKNRH